MRIASRPKVAFIAGLERDAGQQREAIVPRQQFIPDPFLFLRPAAPELPYVGIGRVVPSPPTQPLIGAVQHVAGGKPTSSDRMRTGSNSAERSSARAF